LKSVKNIEKITKSMKVVASTKLTRAERAMKQAKKYGAANEGESEGVVYLDGLNGKRKES
jgi:F0F1-type ATP synthase gamma subunit